MQHPAHRRLPMRLSVLTLCLGLAAPGWAQSVATTPAAQVAISLPSQPLDKALTELAAKTGLLIGVDSSLLAGKQAPAISGTYTPLAALQKLLAGSGLEAVPGSDGSVQLRRMPAGKEDVLPMVSVKGLQETATGPVIGYVAKRSATGTKTDTPIMETPQSISVVTADQIHDQKAQSIADSLAYTPGVSMQSAGFSRMVDDLMIRGFNVANGNLGILRDGMKYQSNVYDGGMEPYGLERIDVVRGAASVLYGQLTPGGLVNAVSKRPSSTPFHEINVEYGTYARKQISSDFSGALDEDGVWTYRLTGLVRKADNWVDYVQDNKTYLAPALTWKPSSNTSLTLLANYQSIDTRFQTPLQYVDVANGTIGRRLFVGEPDFDRYKSVTKSIGYELEHRFDNGVLLRSGARSFDAAVKWDYMVGNLAAVSGGNLARLASKRDEHSTGLTADNAIEFVFDTGAVKHTVLTGVDYYRRTYDSHRYRGTSYRVLDVNNPVYSGIPNLSLSVDRGSDNVGEQRGLYVQDQARFGNWVFVAGTRYDESEAYSRSYQTGRQTNQSDSAVTSRAGLVYLTPGGFAPYLSFSQSFQPQIGADYLTGAAFTPSRGRQVELGARYSPAESGLLFSAAIYDLNQTNVVTSDASGNQYQQGRVSSRGIEFESRWQGKVFGVVAAYAYTDAKVVDSRLASEVNEQLAMVPKHAVSIWGTMALDRAGLPGVKTGLGARYTGRGNLPGYGSDVPAYTLIDALMSYELGALDPKLKGATLSLNARNLFDREYFTCTSFDGCRYGEPRTWTASFSYRW